jgi:hypothetical protein
LTTVAQVPGENSAGLFLTLEELSALFPWLQKNEDRMDIRERQVLNRIERTLYEHLSIDEIENQLTRGSAGYG